LFASSQNAAPIRQNYHPSSHDTMRRMQRRDELTPFHQQILPCFEAEDTTAGELLHCGISTEPLSALGQERTSPTYLAMSALPLKADKQQTCRNVRFVPKADSCTAAKKRRDSIPSSESASSVGGIARHRAAEKRDELASNGYGCAL